MLLVIRALYELRDFQGAVDAFQGALAINPQDTIARYACLCRLIIADFFVVYSPGRVSAIRFEAVVDQ